MELSEEKTKQIWDQKLAENEISKARDKQHKEIFKLWKSSKLSSLNPLWHTIAAEIDLGKQRDNLDSHLLNEGFTILQNIDIEVLFDKMETGNPEMFREKELYNKSLLELSISDVIHNWINNVKLIPPTILVIDKTINSSVNDTSKLYPVDGKHRINVAYYFGATTIPIFVINKQLEKIKSILNI